MQPQLRPHQLYLFSNFYDIKDRDVTITITMENLNAYLYMILILMTRLAVSTGPFSIKWLILNTKSPSHANIYLTWLDSFCDPDPHKQLPNSDVYDYYHHWILEIFYFIFHDDIISFGTVKYKKGAILVGLSCQHEKNQLVMLGIEI